MRVKGGDEVEIVIRGKVSDVMEDRGWFRVVGDGFIFSQTKENESVRIHIEGSE